MKKLDINIIIENFIIYACRSDKKLKEKLESDLDYYQDIMKNEGSGIALCPFKETLVHNLEIPLEDMFNSKTK